MISLVVSAVIRIPTPENSSTTRFSEDNALFLALSSRSLVTANIRTSSTSTEPIKQSSSMVLSARPHQKKFHAWKLSISKSTSSCGLASNGHTTTSRSHYVRSICAMNLHCNLPANWIHQLHYCPKLGLSATKPRSAGD